LAWRVPQHALQLALPVALQRGSLDTVRDDVAALRNAMAGLQCGI
jgi:hypothetical protein